MPAPTDYTGPIRLYWSELFVVFVAAQDEAQGINYFSTQILEDQLLKFTLSL